MALKQTPIPGPVDIASDGSALRLGWPGGETTVHDPFTLRALCPCAMCVDENTGVRTLRPNQVDPGVRLTAAGRVGRYALTLRFSDGHSTGIYAYEKLRDGTYSSQDRT
jgi:DUF971 family protein